MSSAVIEIVSWCKFGGLSEAPSVQPILLVIDGLIGLDCERGGIGDDLPVDIFDFFVSAGVVGEESLFFVAVDVDVLRSGEEREANRLRPGVGGMPRPARAAFKVARYDDARADR